MILFDYIFCDMQEGKCKIMELLLWDAGKK